VREIEEVAEAFRSARGFDRMLADQQQLRMEAEVQRIVTVCCKPCGAGAAGTALPSSTRTS
jgi:hypothetical protein